MLERVLFGGKLQWFGFGFSQHWLPDPAFAVDELIAVAAAVAEKIAVDLAVVTVADTAQHAVSLAGMVLQPRPQCTHTDGAVCRSHLRV